MMKTDPDICVCNPITESFTTFEILIKTENPAFSLRHSSTRRRYNDFCWLRKLLRKHHPLCTCPDLPERKKFSERFEIQFLVKRMKELEEWLQRILSVSLYLSDTAVHLFLQSTLTCKQIEQYLNGKLSQTQFQQAVKDAEIQLDRNASINSVDRDRDDQDDDGRAVPVGATAGQASPVEIRTHPPAVLHNEVQERSDSGIAEFDSDAESSYDSQGSPYVSSLDSGAISDKYPPLTEVCSGLLNSNLSKNSIENPTCVPKTSKDSEIKSINKHMTSLAVENKSKHKIKTVHEQDVFDSHLQFDFTRRKILPPSEVTTSEHTINSVNEGAQNKSNNSKTNKGDTDGKATQVAHKVQMGVLFC